MQGALTCRGGEAMIGRMFLRVHACSGAQRTSVPVALPRHHPLHPVQAAKARLPGAAGVEALHIKPDDRLPHLQCCDLWVGGRGRQAAFLAADNIGRTRRLTSSRASSQASQQTRDGAGRPPSLTSTSPLNAVSNIARISLLCMLAGLPTLGASDQAAGSRRSAGSRWVGAWVGGWVGG